MIEAYKKDGLAEGNKILQRSDFRQYFDKIEGLFQRFSGGYESPHDRCDQFYNLMNQMTPGVDGVSADDRLVFFIQIWFTTHNRLLI